ncbi:MAG: tetratricopeptide repeat protein [Hyphomonadaceae bacterium]|nr:tetratricopeptide repeat protein [Hyphomonadaceae bacterium]MCA8885050.1 tetratricopeptide repeat protein [Hyphomonadaceae bacterium]
MKRALLAGAVIAASVFTAANAMAADTGIGPIVVYGRGPAQDCYVAAISDRHDRGSLAVCSLALNHDFLTREDRTATLVNRGVLLMRRGLDERALSDFEYAASLSPDFGEAQVMRGIALVQLGRYREAVDTLTHAIAMNPDRPERAYFYRAAAYEEVGNASAAYADYRRAADLAPNWGPPRTELTRFVVQ